MIKEIARHMENKTIEKELSQSVKFVEKVKIALIECFSIRLTIKSNPKIFIEEIQ